MQHVTTAKPGANTLETHTKQSNNQTNYYKNSSTTILTTILSSKVTYDFGILNIVYIGNFWLFLWIILSLEASNNKLGCLGSTFLIPSN